MRVHAYTYMYRISQNEPSPPTPLTPTSGAGGEGGEGCFFVLLYIRARGRMQQIEK